MTAHDLPRSARPGGAHHRIEQGLRLGAYIFDELYRGLYRARSTRRRSAVRLPQARIYPPWSGTGVP